MITSNTYRCFSRLDDISQNIVSSEKSSFSVKELKSYSERQYDFYLPLELEKLIIYIRAGHDVLSAIKNITTLEDFKENPVLSILNDIAVLLDNGLNFEEAVLNIQDKLQIHSVKHALSYLLIAHQEGGEIVAPITELSDSVQTQLYEKIEEDIARMPVKAALPVLCAFAGLLICFLIGPVLKFSSMVSTSNMGKF